MITEQEAIEFRFIKKIIPQKAIVKHDFGEWSLFGMTTKCPVWKFIVFKNHG